MRVKGIYYLLLLIGLVSSCKKKPYPENETVNDPVFYFNGNINSNPVSFKAGLDNFYMFSSYAQDVNGVYNFTGALRRTDCAACDNGFFIQLNDLKVTPGGGHSDIATAIKPGRYPLYADLAVPYQVTFKSTFNKAATTYSWNFGDGGSSTAANPVHVYNKPGVYTVALSIRSANGCISYVQNQITVGKTACTAWCYATNIGNNTLAFIPAVTGTAPFEYNWDFGDGSSSTQTNPSHSYAVKGSYPVTLRVKDASGQVAVFNYNVVSSTDISSCNANMQITDMIVADPQSELALGAAFVKWQEPGGLVYTSSAVIQDADGYFEVVSVEDYEPNENGASVKKIKVKVNCKVANAGQVIRVKDAEAVLAVAYY